jgi:hypothetical protein
LSLFFVYTEVKGKLCRARDLKQTVGEASYVIKFIREVKAASLKALCRVKHMLQELLVRAEPVSLGIFSVGSLVNK